MFYFLKKNYILLFTSFFVVAFFLLLYSLTEVAGYQSISPLPGLEVVDTGNPSGLIQYFNRIFVIFISIVAVLGVIKLMICGFQYMTSEAISSKEAAKKCMTGVFGGLFLVLISVLVLQTINPKLIQLTFFDTLQQRIGAIEFSIPDFGVDGGGVAPGEFTGDLPEGAIAHFVLSYEIRPDVAAGSCPAGRTRSFTGLSDCSNVWREIRRAELYSVSRRCSQLAADGPYTAVLLNMCSNRMITLQGPDGTFGSCNSEIRPLRNMLIYNVTTRCLRL